MASDRTEKATPKRLRDARKRGQIARSRDVEAAAQLGAVLLVLAWVGPWMFRGLAHITRIGFEQVGQRARTPIDVADLGSLAFGGVAAVLALAGPVALTAAVATIAAATIQGGWNVAPEALAPKFERLNPASNISRFAPGRVGPNLLKTIIAVTVVSWLASRVVLETMHGSATFARLSPLRAGLAGWDLVERLLWQSALAIGLLAAADYAVQRWQLLNSLKMTKQEIKDEFKLQEGNPEVRARIRRLQREMVRRRMMSDVPKATVVITNPTHYAVALRYERGVMAAPVVVAKGKNLIAQRIREIARGHGVPIVENVPLAQALYKTVDVGQSIPGDLFGAVAEVLAHLIRIRQLAL